MFSVCLFSLQGETLEQCSYDQEELASAGTLSKHPITLYHQQINEEASRVVLTNPSFLSRLGELFKQACESVHSSGYNYKKEKTGSQMVDESDTEAPPTPKHPKMDAEMRQQKMQVLEEDIEALNKQISYKTTAKCRDQQKV